MKLEGNEMGNCFKGFSHEELVLQAQGGCEEAEEYIIREYKDVVRGKAYTYFIVGADVEDVVQEGMIGLIRAIRSYDINREAAFKTYAERCITRQILDAIKAANRKKHSPLNSSISLSKPASGESKKTIEEITTGVDAGNPEALFLMKDLLDSIFKNIEEDFSSMERLVWTSYMEGKSCGEIAKILDKNPKSVYNSMERAKKKITTHFKNLGM